jgi:hypothetical protein
MPADNIIHYILYGAIIIGTYFILKSPKDKDDKKNNKKKDDN